MQQHTFRQTFRRLGVSPNVVWTIVPAVSTPLENAVFALYSGKKPASAQKIHCIIDSQATILSLRLKLLCP
jgi:hypothetical protein